MVPQVRDIASLLAKADEEHLLAKLIMQLQKDFQAANIYIGIETTIPPTDLKKMLHETIYRLMQDRFNDYLNLLYIIDVPEKQVKAIKSIDTLEISEEVTFLVLKREWQKVWFKNKI